jgi:branched-subunit amino acid ABC-type transport system permease component
MAGKSNDDRRKPNRNAKNAKLAPVKSIKVGVIDYKDVAAFSILAIALIFLPSGILGRPDVEKV